MPHPVLELHTESFQNLFHLMGTFCSFAGVSGKQFEVVIKVLKQQQQQQKPKLQPAQAPLQPFDVIPSQHVSLHSPHQAFKAICTSHQPVSNIYKTSTRVR